jgi:hypothetical protein
MDPNSVRSNLPLTFLAKEEGEEGGMEALVADLGILLKGKVKLDRKVRRSCC